MIRVALAQVDCTLGDLEENLRRTAAAIERARADGADLVVFPELNLTGYSLGRVAEDVALDEPRRRAGRAPRRRRADGRGRRLSPRPGACTPTTAPPTSRRASARHVHRKLYLTTYGLFEERKHFSPGQALRAFDTPFGRMAILICNDVWQPMLPCLAVQDGARVLIVPANSSRQRFPGVAGLPEEWRNINRFYARMLECFVVFVNRVGTEGELTFWGGSHVVDPYGQMVSRPRSTSPSVTTVEIDLDLVRRRRHEMPLVKEARLALIAREVGRLADEGGDL